MVRCARVIANLEITDLVPCSIYVINDIAFVALHVIHVEKKFARWTIDRFAYHESLIAVAKKQVGVSLNASSTITRPCGSSISHAGRNASITLLVWYSIGRLRS